MKMQFFALFMGLSLVATTTFCPEPTVFDPDEMDVVITTPSGSVPSK